MNPLKEAGPAYWLALSAAIVIAALALTGCPADVRPLIPPTVTPGGDPPPPPPPPPPGDCTCEGYQCGPEVGSCFQGCAPGSGCYVPTGYCVPDASGVCPPVDPPTCDDDHGDGHPPRNLPHEHPCCNGKHLGDKHCVNVTCGD